MDGAVCLDLRGGADCAEWGQAYCGWRIAEGRPAGGVVADDCAVLDFVQQATDGTELARRRHGLWAAAGNVDADGVCSTAVWNAAGGGGFVEGMAGAGGERRAVYGDDHPAVELGDDAGSSFTGGSAFEYGAADGERAGSCGAGGAAGAERVGWGRADFGGGGYVDHALQDQSARTDAADVAGGC